MAKCAKAQDNFTVLLTVVCLLAPVFLVKVSRSYLLMGPVTAHVNINGVWRQDYLPACMDAN